MKDTGEYNATFSDLFEKIEKEPKRATVGRRVQGKPSQAFTSRTARR